MPAFNSSFSKDSSMNKRKYLPFRDSDNEDEVVAKKSFDFGRKFKHR